jgi:hypothetical protein
MLDSEQIGIIFANVLNQLVFVKVGLFLFPAETEFLNII